MVHAYVGGGLVEGTVGDEAWVIGAVDGVVVGGSPIFLEESHDEGFAFLIDADRLPPDGVDLELFVWEDGSLHPIELRGE